MKFAFFSCSTFPLMFQEILTEFSTSNTACSSTLLQPHKLLIHFSASFDVDELLEWQSTRRHENARYVINF